MTSQDRTDQSRSETSRFWIDRRLLVAVILGPITLGIVRNGYHHVAGSFLLKIAASVIPSSPIVTISTFASAICLTLAILLAWRPRGFGAPRSRAISILVLTMVSSVFAFVPQWISLRGYFYDSLHGAALYLLGIVVFLSVSLFIMTLVRRVFGVCFVLDAATKIPDRRRVSIAELGAWTAAVAGLIALSSFAIDVWASEWGLGETEGITPYIHLAIHTLFMCLPILFMAATGLLQWRTRIALCFAFVVFMTYANHYLQTTVLWPGLIVNLRHWDMICSSLYDTSILIIAFWLVNARGYQATFLQR